MWWERGVEGLNELLGGEEEDFEPDSIGGPDHGLYVRGEVGLAVHCHSDKLVGEGVLVTLGRSKYEKGRGIP